jgi:uncharacterized Zn finger protein
VKELKEGKDMREKKPPTTLGQRWRKDASKGVDDQHLAKALSAMSTIKKLRIQAGAIQGEVEGAMGSINEVSIHVPVLQSRIFPSLARVLRRSATVLEALGHGSVPRSFDRIVARIAGESIFPETKRVATACTCGSPDKPCRHILALHELFARRLEERPWELLTLRGIHLHDLLARAKSKEPDESLPALAFGAEEEPVLFPEGEQGNFDQLLAVEQVRSLLGIALGEREKAIIAATEQSPDAAGA